jgi:nitroreductase
MDAIQCIESRRSIRKFKTQPVSNETLKEIFKTARWSPSYKNTQPWECILLSGAKKNAVTEMMIQLLDKNEKPCPDMPEPQSWPPVEAARIDRLMKRRAQMTGKSLNDPEALRMAKKANFSFYGAPHALYLYQDASLTPWSLFDMGLFAQTLMLAANARGVATVPQAFATDYAKYVKEFLGIPETKRLIIGISIGYADAEAPENAFRTDRIEVLDFVKWME